MTRRAGFTLIETLLVVVVISLCGLIAMPKFRDAVATNNVASARAKIMALYSTARANSAGSGRVTWLHLDGNNAYVTAVLAGGALDTITPIESMSGQYGVNVVTTQDSVMINQSGIGRTAATIRILKGIRADTIQISSYGRVMK